MSGDKEPMTYLDAGVDIDSGDALIDAIKPLAESTNREGCLGGVGGFGAMFQLPARFKDPVLISGTDGVGTKLKLAFEYDRHDTIGIDLVAMCVNDVLVQGAEPLFFLDYFATGGLDPGRTVAVVRGIAEGCRQAGAALIGGETAEMPGMYASGEYDLAGFCVGAVERGDIIDGSTIEAGHVIIGVASSGFHSNGYSLVRRVLDTRAIEKDLILDDVPLRDLLLEPTRIYVKPVLSLLRRVKIHGMAHITGGGLPGNLQRIIPDVYSADIDESSWQWPRIFAWLQDLGNIEKSEMYRTFNCGIGLVLVLAHHHADEAISHLRRSGDRAWVIGRIERADGSSRVLIR